MTDLERVAAAIEAAFYAAVDSGTNTERFVPIARAAIAAMPTIERLSAELAELKLDKAELERVCKVQVEVVAELEERIRLSNTAENG